jgi:hypothetical protein
MRRDYYCVIKLSIPIDKYIPLSVTVFVAACYYDLPLQSRAAEVAQYRLVSFNASSTLFQTE